MLSYLNIKKILNLVSRLLLVSLFIFSSNSSAFQFYTVHLPPFSFINNKKIEGPMHDIAQRVCSDLKLNCSFNTSPWKRIMMNVKSGKYQACYVVGKNDERLQWMNFTIPIITTEYGFFSHNSSKSQPKRYEDLSGLSIVVHQKSNTAEKLFQLKSKGYNFKIIEEVDIHTAIRKFSNGRYPSSALFYGNKHISKYLFNEIRAKNISYAFKDREIQYRYGFSKKSVPETEFNKFNNRLIELDKSGELKKMLAHSLDK